MMMKFDYKHFQNNMLPGEVLKSMKILEKLHDSLKEILFDEIEGGNKIFDVTTGWPEPDSIFVQTRYSFKKKHQKKGIEYKNLDDPHYWKEEYSSKNPAHLIVCPFLKN